MNNFDSELLYGIIYSINFPNDKIYIGQTIRPLNTRIEEHILKSKKNPDLLVHKAINKYGIEKIKYEVIDYAYSFEELNELEKYYIKKFESRRIKFPGIILSGRAGIPPHHRVNS